MTFEIPIACSLTAAELPRRLDEMRAIGEDALLCVDSGGAIHFRADEVTRERLRAIVEAESRCCPFLSFDLQEDAGELVLSIGAPAGAEPLALDMVDAFAGTTETR